MSEKIFIIEDDKFLRDLCKKKLDNEGFNVTAAVDGEDGLEKLKTERPDLILLDIVLPGINGFEVLKEIKGDKNLQNIPVIMLTNLGQRDDVEKGISLGAADYLIKSNLTPSEIVKRIRVILKK